VFDTVLVANRGEIALRVMRTCRELGVRTVAVYSDVDADALHVREADHAVRLGPAPAFESYLDMEAVLAAAETSGAQAIHPGYGFLSESADFAEKVVGAGLTWIGPPADVIRLMGDKAAAKARMAEAGVPIIPGIDTAALDDEDIIAACAEVGFPVLLKAVAGGGGKGMRPVHVMEELSDALASARREARGAFGDDRIIVEKLINRPRHIEVQVFGDSHGNVVHLFERECSIQRRHQKIVEETPSPAVDPQLRGTICHAAVEAARAVGYVGAGTVEFILAQSDGEAAFHFLEMNTRLQVEHPITELITGVDLVAWQLRVAAGELLPTTQDELHPQGHAIEVRLYAENPAEGFLPQTGKIERFEVPAGHGIRVDAGVETGSTISRFYDPLLAKLVVHAAARDTAVSRLRDLLEHTLIHGVGTNLEHLAAIVAHPAFAAGDLDTAFLDRHLPDWRPIPASGPAVAAIAALLTKPPGGNPADPWHTIGAWRLSASGGAPLRLEEGDDHHVAVVRLQGGRLTVTVGGALHEVSEVAEQGPDVRLKVDGHPLVARLTRSGDDVWAQIAGRTHRMRLQRATHHADASAISGAGTLTAPMSGAVIDIRVSPGDHVVSGQVLMVVEAMKMEHPVVSPGDGVVTAVHVTVGNVVKGDMPLLDWEPADNATPDEGASP
jgi:acetyl-CoA/propionyl-CoA carboxylase biotin carboxyl carrier protein